MHQRHVLRDTQKIGVVVPGIIKLRRQCPGQLCSAWQELTITTPRFTFRPITQIDSGSEKRNELARDNGVDHPAVIVIVRRVYSCTNWLHIENLEHCQV